MKKADVKDKNESKEKIKNSNKNLSLKQVENKVKSFNNEKKILKFTENKKIEQNFGLFEYILLGVILLLIFSLLGYFIGRTNNTFNNSFITVDKEIQKFIEEYNYILNNYYGDIDEEELIANAIKGMLTSLDDYSQFIDNGSNNFEISLKGEFEGIGIGILNDNSGNIFISTIYPNSPAAKVGLKENDIIKKINDQYLENVSTTDLVDKISNLESFELTILRNEEELKFNLEKDIIIIESVHSELLENNIGYLKVDTFAQNTDEQFEKKLKDLESKNMTGLIIDLRNNGGGHLTTVENMLSLFLNNTHVIYQTEDKNNIEKIYSDGKEDKKYPIVILQNVSSASASEIMATALKEQLGAYIIGNTSYGKGTVQNLQTISGIGQYKITTKKWLTSNGIWINDIGVSPDLEISISEDYLKNPILENDNQYQSAIKYMEEK